MSIARNATTALALCVITTAGTRVVYDHHDALTGLRHLTIRHATHTALVELGLRRRAPNAVAKPDSTAAIGPAPVDGDTAKERRRR